MSTLQPTRRQFLGSAALASLSLPAHAAGSVPPEASATTGTDVLRSPDSIAALYSDGSVQPMHRGGAAWSAPGVELIADPLQLEGAPAVRFTLQVSALGITRLRVRWQGANSEDALCMGDHWERAYGDLEWKGTQPERIMPWYFVVRSTAGMQGYGVQTGAAALCFWQRDASGITLSIDLRNGGAAADLRGRKFSPCTVVQRSFPTEIPFHEAMQAFCARMCPAPRLPQTPLFGVNDWNYAYGKNTAAGILRDADLLASLAPAGAARPYVVIDDGWQDPQRFPSMPELAAQIRKRSLHPGLWIRPLRAPAHTAPNLLLPPSRFGAEAKDAALAYDPTLPEALTQVLQSVQDPIAWGYTLLKHDFSTWELFGRWGFQFGDEFTGPGWNFHDRTLTNAEVISGFYRQLRAAAGDGTVVLGCNTVGHLAAGLFESQRIGDDTSGKDWERTRRMGVNALAQRLGQHRTFFHIDPDIVAITPQVEWRMTQSWMDLVARTGGSLFFAPAPAAMTPEAKAAMREAMALVVQQPGAYPVQPNQSTTPERWHSERIGEQIIRYEWTPDGSPSAASV